MVLSPEQRVRVFTRFAEETGELALRPDWYNTVTRNCTSSLVRYANESRPGAIPWHHSWIFTGHMNEYLAELGYIDESSRQHITRDWLASRPLR
jgi:hypothetical protein